MKPYLAIFNLRMINGLQYRIAALAGVATQFVWGFMYIMIYEAFYHGFTGTQTISLEQLATYIWLQQAFFFFVLLWLKDNEIFDSITSGSIAYELCRPCGIYGFWFAKLIAHRLSGTLLRCMPILVIGFFLPIPYRLSLPPNFLTFILFLVTLLLGLIVVISLSMIVYVSVFVTMSPIGSFLIFSVVGEFFSGLMMPVPLMPIWLQNIVYILPFRLSGDLPFRVYSGNISTNDAIIGILTQILWIIGLIALGKVLLTKMLKRVVVQGG
ncbi:MAG TPA: ABC transporter permease [Clostridiales bacterium]|nr:MAG: ABC transporter permease [Clostridiales bacterium GWD2_32_19]HCC07228.1 ABC transporter permease [Clostridiales bacterium]